MEKLDSTYKIRTEDKKWKKVLPLPGLRNTSILQQTSPGQQPTTKPINYELSKFCEYNSRAEIKIINKIVPRMVFLALS